MRRFLTLLLREREFGLGALILLLTLAASLRDPAFLSGQNGVDLLVNAAPILVLTCALVPVMLIGEIDISIGSLTGLLAGLLAVMTSTSQLQWSPFLAVGLVAAGGMLIGLGTAALVTWGRIPSIIATLGLLSAWRGIMIWVMRGQQIGDFPSAIRWWGTGTLAGVPVLIWLAAIAVAALWWLIQHTALGRHWLALGSNPSAARTAGLAVRRLQCLAFAWCGGLTALATLMLVGKLGVVDASVGRGYELLAVTCAVVGGVSIRGGRGRWQGVMLAVLLMVMIKTVLIFLKLGDESAKWERAIQGGFILLAVAVDRLSERRSQPMEAGA